jgi:hypothetical protein
MHWPEALHVDGPVYTSVTQVSAAHWVPEGYLRHAIAPSHFPSVEHIAAVRSRQVLRGSALPAGVAVQRPVAQLRHAPAQAVLQQMPGPPIVSLTQCWFAQSESREQGWPSTIVPQVPFAMQATPVLQSVAMVAVVQRVLQVPFEHW